VDAEGQPHLSRDGGKEVLCGLDWMKSWARKDEKKREEE